jgi:hypothetical protein
MPNEQSIETVGKMVRPRPVAGGICVRQFPDRADVQRREELGYDVALARLAKGVCPGCERSVDMKDPANDFCPHCGIGLHDHCGQCNSRKGAFARFCHACGTAAGFRNRTAA